MRVRRRRHSETVDREHPKRLQPWFFALASAGLVVTGAVLFALLRNNSQGTVAAGDGLPNSSSVRVPGAGASTAARPRPTPKPRQIRGSVIFAAAPALEPRLEPSFTQSDQSVVPVKRVGSDAGLKAALDDSVTAIIIERGLENSIDWAWVQDRFTEGRAIVGLNIPMGELIDLLYPAVSAILPDLGWKRGEPAFYRGPSDSVIFNGGPVQDLTTCAGGLENPYGPEWDEGGLVSDLRNAIGCVPARFGRG